MSLQQFGGPSIGRNMNSLRSVKAMTRKKRSTTSSHTTSLSVKANRINKLNNSDFLFPTLKASRKQTPEESVALLGTKETKESLKARLESNSRIENAVRKGRERLREHDRSLSGTSNSTITSNSTSKDASDDNVLAARIEYKESNSELPNKKLIECSIGSHICDDEWSNN